MIRKIAVLLPLVALSSCAPALIAGSIGGAILAVPATSWLMEPPQDNHLITAVFKSNSLDDAVIQAWNRVRLYESPVLSSKGLQKVLLVAKRLNVWEGAEVQDMIENGKDVIELTIQRGFKPDDSYQVTIALHARTLKNPENWLVAPPPPVKKVVIQTGKLGTNTGKLGNQNVATGNHAGKTGNQSVQKGTNTGTLGNKTEHSGKNTEKLGNKKVKVMDHWIGGPSTPAQEEQDTPPVDDSSETIGTQKPAEKKDTPPMDHWIGGPN